MTLIVGSRNFAATAVKSVCSCGLRFGSRKAVSSFVTRGTAQSLVEERRSTWGQIRGQSICTTSTLQGRLLRVEESSSEQVDLNPSNVITIPVHLKKRLERRQLRESPEKRHGQKILAASRAGNKSKIILQARRPELNHYVGQSYEKGKDIPLVSKGWKHHKASGDWFVCRPLKKSAEYGFCEGSPTTFEDLQVSPVLIERLKQNKAFKPTNIQEIAIPEILKGQNNVITAETGCGKTLAYLLPVVQQIMLKKQDGTERGVNQPLAVILVPSRELAEQIHYVACKLTEGLNLDVRLLQGGNIGSQLASARMNYVDLLISTVHVARELSSGGIFNMKHVEHVVLDEADSLLDDSFVDEIVPLLRRFPFEPSFEVENHVQITLVSATLPRSVEEVLEEIIPLESLYRITTPEVHSIMPHVTQTFLRMKKGRKPEELLKILKPDVENRIPVMIFCNKVETCNWMFHHLKRNDIHCVVLHGETFSANRRGLLQKYNNGEVDIIVCSDLGSRGIDSTRTGHVINYDFPMFLANYIHRCGRTGRVGSRGGGRITNFISGRIEVEVVQEIERSIRKEMVLSRVNANIKRIISTHYGMFKPILPESE